MNPTRIALAGVAAGFATWISDFVLHGMVMASTYKSLSQVFAQTAANPGWFLLVALSINLAAAFLFAKTRSSWAGGWKGGVTFGFCLGLVIFFQPFYDPLVVDGFPYYLAWCQGGISLIDNLLAGAVMGSMLKA